MEGFKIKPFNCYFRSSGLCTDRSPGVNMDSPLLPSDNKTESQSQLRQIFKGFLSLFSVSWEVYFNCRHHGEQGHYTEWDSIESGVEKIASTHANYSALTLKTKYVFVG